MARVEVGIGAGLTWRVYAMGEGAVWVAVVAPYRVRVTVVAPVGRAVFVSE